MKPAILIGASAVGGHVEETDTRKAPRAMKQLFILLWVLWAQMLWVFGIPSYYFLFAHHFSAWAYVSVPAFLFTLFAGWRLFIRSRQEWRQSA